MCYDDISRPAKNTNKTRKDIKMAETTSTVTTNKTQENFLIDILNNQIVQIGIIAFVTYKLLDKFNFGDHAEYNGGNI